MYVCDYVTFCWKIKLQVTSLIAQVLHFLGNYIKLHIELTLSFALLAKRLEFKSVVINCGLFSVWCSNPFTRGSLNHGARFDLLLQNHLRLTLDLLKPYLHIKQPHHYTIMLPSILDINFPPATEIIRSRTLRNKCIGLKKKSKYWRAVVFNCRCFRKRFYIGYWIGSFTSGTSKGTSLSLFLRISASKRRVLSLGAKFSSCIFIQVASAFRQSLVSSDEKKKTMSVQSRNAHPLFGISSPTHETYCRGVTNSGTCHLCHTRTAWQSCPPCSQGAPSGEREIQTVIHTIDL